MSDKRRQAIAAFHFVNRAGSASACTMSTILFFVCFASVQCMTENVIWKDGKCTVKGNPPKPMIGLHGGYSGYCLPDRFYINPRTPCKHCPGRGTNCCENTFRTCFYDKNVNGSCDWAKNVTSTTATPKSKKPKTSTTLPKDTNEAPCITGNDNTPFYETERNVVTPGTPANKVHSPTPSPTPSLPTDHHLEDTTTTQEQKEPTIWIAFWVVLALLLFSLAVLVFICRENIVRIKNNLMESIRKTFCSEETDDDDALAVPLRGNTT